MQNVWLFGGNLVTFCIYMYVMHVFNPNFTLLIKITLNFMYSSIREMYSVVTSQIFSRAPVEREACNEFII